jgi:hypothetical protein
MRNIERRTPTGGCGLAVLLFSFFLCTPVRSQDQEPLPQIEITIATPENTIQQILDRITLQTGYLFTYDADLIDGRKQVDFRVTEISLFEALDSLLQNPGLGYRIIDRNIVIYQRNKEPPQPVFEEIERSILRGSVMDAKSGKPLAYATIALYGTSLGSITNQEGEFSFKIPLNLTDPMLVVSFMGYSRTFIPVVYPVDDPMTIALERELIPLQEVIIRFSDPAVLLTESLKRISDNYLDSDATMTAFYRESIRRNNHFMVYSEAVLDVAKASYTSEFSEDAARIIKGRTITDVTSEDTILVKLRSGIHTSLFLDVIKNRPDFLLPDFQERYNLEFTDLMVYGERLVYVISFEQKSNITDPLFKGKAYLDQESLALLAADFEFNPALIHKQPGIFLVSRSPSIRIRPFVAKYHVDYRELGGRYHVSQVRAEVGMKIRRKRKWIGSRYLISIEMAITDVIPDQRLRIIPSERVRQNVVLSEEPFQFDPLFWGIYNTIEPEASLMESIQRLEEYRENMDRAAPTNQNQFP